MKGSVNAEGKGQCKCKKNCECETESTDGAILTSHCTTPPHSVYEVRLSWTQNTETIQKAFLNFMI